MYSRSLYYILQFDQLILFTVVSLIAVTILLLLQMRDFSWTSRRRLLVITLFFNMAPRYMIYLAANYIQLMFMLSMLVTMQEVQLSHLILLVLLGLIQALAIAEPAESVRSFVGSVLLYAAFLIVDLLRTYIFALRFDWRIAFVFALMCAFLVLYSLYFFINSIKCLASRHTAAVRQRRQIEMGRREHHQAPKPGEDVGLIDLDVEDL